MRRTGNPGCRARIELDNLSSTGSMANAKLIGDHKLLDPNHLAPRTPRAALDIAVMLGGPSAEREISLRSGDAVSSALRSLGHRVHELDPCNPNWILPSETQ